MSLSREEIIRMAREAGVIPCLVETTGTYFAHVETLANAAYAAGAAAEREACLSTEKNVALSPALFPSISEWKAYKNGADSVLNTIRARGNGGEK